jgi:FKBP-type peptidyl-prolyl cis-trans isomerase SlpA
MRRIGPSSHVTLHYRMAILVDGGERELVNTFGAAPATLQMGVGQWSESIEQRLLGMDEGAACEFELAPEHAYGEHRSDLVLRLARERVQAELRERGAPPPSWQVGAELDFPGPDGTGWRGMLTACDAEHAVVDFNHPLAGRPLRVRVQVIGVL